MSKTDVATNLIMKVAAMYLLVEERQSEITKSEMVKIIKELGNLACDGFLYLSREKSQN